MVQQYCFSCQEGGFLLLTTAILLWLYPLYPENMEGDKTFFDKSPNSAVGPNSTANSNWAIGYYLQSGWGFVFLVLRLNWFSGLPLLKWSIPLPPSPGHTYLLLPWCWLLCLLDPTINQFHSLNQRKLTQQKRDLVEERKHLSQGSHQCCNWYKAGGSEWRRQDCHFK